MKQLDLTFFKLGHHLLQASEECHYYRFQLAENPLQASNYGEIFMSKEAEKPSRIIFYDEHHQTEQLDETPSWFMDCFNILKRSYHV